MAPAAAAKLHRLQAALRSAGRAAVAFSGGVDSSFLLRVAADTLGPANVLAIIGDSPSLPRHELALARQFAAATGVECLVIFPEEMRNPRYTANPPDRCYFCKHALFTGVRQAAANRGIATILEGSNADDTGDHRPGRRAAAELGVQSPLLEAGLAKAEIRELSRHLGLPTADKPAMACLASRLPYGTPVTAASLAQVEAAESRLRDAGFRGARVRHHGDIARLELDPAEFPRLLDPNLRGELTAALKRLGWRYVSLDLQGYRTGSLNEAL
ncbi:MAG: ATP-dependent sacrificial sulfur transferase LarE [Lentisphaeria bacterium]|jgi:uncharacterized protein